MKLTDYDAHMAMKNQANDAYTRVMNRVNEDRAMKYRNRVALKTVLWCVACAFVAAYIVACVSLEVFA